VVAEMSASRWRVEVEPGHGPLGRCRLRLRWSEVPGPLVECGRNREAGGSLRAVPRRPHRGIGPQRTRSGVIGRSGWSCGR